MAEISMSAHLDAVLERAQAYALENRRNMQRWISRSCPKSYAPAIEADAVAMYGIAGYSRRSSRRPAPPLITRWG